MDKHDTLGDCPPQTALDLTRQALDNRLIGASNEPLHLRGTERGLDVYCCDPRGWPGGAPQVCWVGLPVPLSQANLHFLVAGVPGTGKTLSFRLLLQSVFAANTALPGNDRAVIYDPKQEFYPILRGMRVPDERVAIMNPFDCRCTAWHLADDYCTPADAFQLAKTMIPCPEEHSQPFFPKSAAAILTGVICALMQKNRDGWDLADVLLNCLNETRISGLLDSAGWSPYIEMARSTLGAGDTKHNVLAELTSHLFEYLPIAARWREATRQGRYTSLSNFVASPDGILLLGANQTYSQSLQVMNRLLLKRLSEITMDEVADGQWEAMNRTWLVLDELRELGKVPGLADFINKGRSRGVCAVLGFQDYAGLKEAFGENVAHEITATCAHRIFLRLGGESAEWASRSIGKAEILSTTFSFSGGSAIGVSAQHGKSSTWGANASITDSTTVGFSFTLSSNVTRSQQIRETDAILPSEISNLPSFEEGAGITGLVCRRQQAGSGVVERLFFPRELLLGLIDESSDLGFKPWDSGALEW